jgi:hypothetical protein
MTFRSCTYEEEVVRALKAGHWPDGCALELCEHVEACENCSDLVLVTQSFQLARREAELETIADSASLLWWRAQLRRRNAAAERVSRPITIAQRFALFVYGVVGLLFVASQYSHGLRWSSWWSELGGGRVLHFSYARPGTLDGNLPLLVLCLGALALLSGLVVYLASEKS